MVRKHLLPTLILTSCMLLATFIPLFTTLPWAEAQAGQREKLPIHVNMKAGDAFTPETEHDANHTAEVKHVVANHDQFGNIIYNVDWADVGTWSSGALDGDFDADGRVVFNVWYQVTENINNNNVDWEFRLKYNDEEICYARIDSADQSTDHPVMVSVETTLNSTLMANSGGQFAISLRYRSAADCDVYYDNIQYNSGASIVADSVVIFAGGRSGGDAWVDVYDAFGTNWERNGKYFCGITVGVEGGPGNDETETDDGGEYKGDGGMEYETTRITFKEVPSKGSTTITVAYGPVGNGTSESWSLAITKGSSGDGDDDGGGDVMVYGVVGIGVVGVAVGALFFMKKKGGGDEEARYEDDEDYEDDYDEEDEMEYES